MNEETILNFIKKGESETVEFKSTLDQAAIETLAAFANTKGGYVFVGVADSGKIVGVQLGNETIPQWLNQIKTNTFPTLLPDVATAAIDHKDVVIFMIDEFPIKPVSCRGKYPPSGASRNRGEHDCPPRLHEFKRFHDQDI